MKEGIKKFLPVAAAVLIVAAVVVGAGFIFGGKDDAALEYIDPQDNVTGSVSQSFVSLWIAVQKNALADIIYGVEQTPDGWNLVVDKQTGKTFNELFREDCILSLSKILAIEYLHDYYYGLEFTDEQQISIDMDIERLVAAFGSYDALETALQKYGATVEDYELYQRLMLKQSSLFASLYNENGLRPITEDEIKQYFVKKYAVVYHIYIDTRGYKKEDGTILSFTDEELAEKRAYADEIYGKITGGELTFEEAFLTYNEDAHASQKPYGYFVTQGDMYPEEFTSAAFSLLDGEVTKIETSSGIHIIKRFEMDEELYNKDPEVYETIVQTLKLKDFTELISTVMDGVKVNDEIVNELDAALIVPFAGF